MARFDVYRNKAAMEPPYLLQIQSEYHHHLTTCVIIPLRSPKHITHKQIERLMPSLEVEGSLYLLMTTEMGAVLTQQLGQKVASLSDKHYEITSAVDFLMQGF